MCGPKRQRLHNEGLVWTSDLILLDSIVDVITYPGLNIALRSANERRRYKVTPSPIGWTQT